MILEHAVLQVKPGTQAEFTDTFDRARAEGVASLEATGGHAAAGGAAGRMRA